VTLAIFQDSKGDGTCRSCGRPIVWAELTSGKRHPFDYPLVVASVQPEMFGEPARVVEHVDTAVSPSHFATCPDAAQHRRPRKGR
jgi:hypothetical protein